MIRRIVGSWGRKGSLFRYWNKRHVVFGKANEVKDSRVEGISLHGHYF